MLHQTAQHPGFDEGEKSFAQAIIIDDGLSLRIEPEREQRQDKGTPGLGAPSETLHLPGMPGRLHLM